MLAASSAAQMIFDGANVVTFRQRIKLFLLKFVKSRQIYSFFGE